MTTTTNLHEPTLERLTALVDDALRDTFDLNENRDLVDAAIQTTVLLLAARPSIGRALWNGHWKHVTGAGH